MERLLALRIRIEQTAAWEQTAASSERGTGSVPSSQQGSSSQGKYSRDFGKGKRSGWKKHVRTYMKLVRDTDILRFLICDDACVNMGTCAKLVTLSMVEHTALLSFGVTPETMLDDDDAPAWSQVVRNHAANKQWYEFVLAGRRAADEGFLVTYQVQSQPVCMSAWGHLHGVSPATMQTMHNKACKGIPAWSDLCTTQAISAGKAIRADLTEAATTWWYQRLQYYEFRTKHGVIAHPRAIHWGNVYDHEFVPFMILCGYPWLPPMADMSSLEQMSAADGRKGSRATWYKGRTRALQRLGNERLGGTAFRYSFSSNIHFISISYHTHTPLSPTSSPSLGSFHASSTRHIKSVTRVKHFGSASPRASKIYYHRR